MNGRTATPGRDETGAVTDVAAPVTWRRCKSDDIVGNHHHPASPSTSAIAAAVTSQGNRIRVAGAPVGGCAAPPSVEVNQPRYTLHGCRMFFGALPPPSTHALSIHA